MIDGQALAGVPAGMPLPTAAAGVSRETRPVNITVSTLTADARSGQAVVDAIRDYERTTGRHLIG